MFSKTNLGKGGFILITILASAWLLWLIDDGMQLGWPSNVLRNWQEFGLSQMHGALVQNPGGFEAVSHPDIYHGMSPWYLYPVYFCTMAFAWTNLAAMPYHVLLAVLVFWGVWSLLRKSTLALLAAALVLVSPGYGCWQKGIDPNAISVLLGFPYAAMVMQLLKQPDRSLRQWALLFLLTALFLPLNWTTAWFLAPFGLCLLLDPEVRRQPALVYLVVTGIGSVVFVGFSMLAKHGGAAAAAGLPAATGAAQGGFLSGYTWGTNGYYEGLSTVRFFTRLVFVNIVALLPLLLWWGWRTAQCIVRTPRKGWISLLPLLMALIELAGMRNYFCHHPWMASPVVIAGLVLSLALLASGDAAPESPASLKWVAAGTAGAVLYGALVLAVLHANRQNALALDYLVRENVPRTETLVIVRAADPATAGLSKDLDQQLDRHVVVVETLDDAPQDTPFAVLSSVPLNKLRLVTETPANSATGVTAQAAHWFNRNIGHRKTSDRLEFAAHYYIYRPGP
jgi:hypothetical protein